MAIGQISGVVKKIIGTQVYYYGTVQSDKIKNITFVPTIELSTRSYLNERIEEGYQRPGSRNRMRMFMKYLDKNPNNLVPPILISGRDGWVFEPEYQDIYGKLIINKPSAIIDGQHRVGGYIALFEEKGDVRPMDIIVLENLSLEMEKSEFITVNNTQIGVPKALTEYLIGEEPARIAWALNNEDNSIFKGRITRTKIQKQNLFALHSVAKNVERTFNHGKLRDLSEDTKIDIMMRYWTIIADSLPTEWADIEKLDNTESRGRNDFKYKLLELTGFIAWSLIAPEILGRCYVDGFGINWDFVKSLVLSCGNIMWDKDGPFIGRTGEVGGKAIRDEMQRLLPPDAAVLPHNNDGE